MSEDTRWDIDTIKYYDGWLWTALDGTDFILELVHEIERLQTEIIDQRDKHAEFTSDMKTVFMGMMGR